MSRLIAAKDKNMAVCATCVDRSDAWRRLVTARITAKNKLQQWLPTFCDSWPTRKSQKMFYFINNQTKPGIFFKFLSQQNWEFLVVFVATKPDIFSHFCGHKTAL